MSNFSLPEGVRGHGDGSRPDGMLSVEEGAFLAEHARGKRVLELGSWCGLSTIVMARVAREVWACDWHCGDNEMGEHNTLPEMWANLCRYAVECCPVVLLVGKFEQTLPQLWGDQFDMAYIDGSHDPAQVMHDATEATRLVPVGGLIVFHDADREPVRRAAESVGCLEKLTLGPGRLGWAEVR